MDHEGTLVGHCVLATSLDSSVPAAEVLARYRLLQQLFPRFQRSHKLLDLRHVDDRRTGRIIAHVQLCWLALLLIHTCDIVVGDTWRNLGFTLDTILPGPLAIEAGIVAKRSRLDEKPRSILQALALPEPTRYHDVAPVAG